MVRCAFYILSSCSGYIRQPNRKLMVHGLNNCYYGASMELNRQICIARGKEGGALSRIYANSLDYDPPSIPHYDSDCRLLSYKPSMD